MEGDCLAGMIMDHCNCCLICGRREGERCFSEALRGRVSADQETYAACGQNLECTLMAESVGGSPLFSSSVNIGGEALCVCRSTEPVCSSEGTAENECQFLEARYRTRSSDSVLYKLHDGPCKSVPQIISPPEDITNNTGSSVAFSCEVKGWPLPTVEWRLLTTTESGNEEKWTTLTPDGEQIWVHTLSDGPSNYETTSWLQMIGLKREHSGLYACVASNSEGEARATAYLTIGNFKRDFPDPERK